jgi:hypothetical protein
VILSPFLQISVNKKVEKENGMKRVMVLLVWIFLGMAISVSPLAIANEQGQQISCSAHMPAEFFHGHNIGIIVTLDNVPAGMEVVAIYARSG